jgi:hypothetical protein
MTLFLENSGVFYNNREIYAVFCQGCNNFVEFKVKSGCVDLDTCNCIRITSRIYLETKGNILNKKIKMYEK